MRLYLDCCCFNRPFDAADQGRVIMEAEAISLILARIDKGDWQLVISDAVIYELRRIPDPIRRDACLTMAEASVHHVRTNALIAQDIYRLVGLGFSQMDAAHLAYAAAGRVDAFLTVDDRLLRKARSMGDPSLPMVANPLDWIAELEKEPPR